MQSLSCYSLRPHSFLLLFCRTLSHDPLALDPDCIHIVGAIVFGGSKYHVVASDDNDFNAVLPAWGIREAYVGPANTLASVCHHMPQHHTWIYLIT